MDKLSELVEANYNVDLEGDYYKKLCVFKPDRRTK